MSKFNSTVLNKPDTVNLAGGSAYTQSTELEIATLLLTSFLTDKSYEKESQQIERLKKLFDKLPENNKQFMAKASIYARQEFGMRSISHLCAALISNYKKGRGTWCERYITKNVRRVDDITETIACYMSLYDKKLPWSLKYGLAKAFDKFDEYQLAKYQAKGKEVSLIDAVRLCHPKPCAKNAEALDKLIHGQLKQTETWNAQLSNVKKSDDVEQVTKDKQQVWHNFVSKGNKVEYFALLRNLRNMLEQATPEDYNTALQLLCDKQLIKTSKVLPFRYLTAFKQFTDRATRIALSNAVDISMKNVPKFDGSTAILLDVSGSMTGRVADTNLSMAEVGALFAAALYKTNDADIVMFSDFAKYFVGNPLDSTTTIVNSIPFACGGTNFNVAFQQLNRKYDRIIILSDMQSWGHGYYSCNDAFKNYKRAYNCPNCKLYSFDLTGYGTSQFPETNVYTLAGFSEKTFDIMQKMESANDLVNIINSIQI